MLGSVVTKFCTPSQKFLNKKFFNSDGNICTIYNVDDDEVCWLQHNTGKSYTVHKSFFENKLKKNEYYFDRIGELLYG